MTSHNRQTPLARLVASLPALELVALARGLEGVVPGCGDAHHWDLLRLAGDGDDAPLDALWARLGGGEQATVGAMGGGAPCEFATVRAREPFGAWAAALLASPRVIHVFVVPAGVDALVRLRVVDGATRATVVRDLRARLLEHVARARAARDARADDALARLRATLEPLRSVRVVAGGKAPAPQPATLYGAVPWDQVPFARRLRAHGEAPPGAWIAAQLERFAPGARCSVAVPEATAWISVRLEGDASWLAALWPTTPRLLVRSGDGRRVLALRADEHDDVAGGFPIAALLDRATSREALDAAIAVADGVRVLSPSGRSNRNIRSVFASARRVFCGPLRDARDAAACLAPLRAATPVDAELAAALAREKALECFDLSAGRRMPSWTLVWTFVRDQWLVDLFHAGLARLLVASHDHATVLAIRRHGDGVEAFVGPLREARER